MTRETEFNSMQKTNAKPHPHQNRRGIAILWLILWGGMFLTFFCVVLEISAMWQAQVELNNTMDAAALAAVREWGLSGASTTQVARDVGVAYVGANPVQGSTVSVTTNYAPGNSPNQNASLSGNFVFGALDSIVSPITFDPDAQGGCSLGNVTITINKPNGSVASNKEVKAEQIKVEYTSTNITNLQIQSIKFTLPAPVVPGNNNKNAAYYDAAQPPQVSQDPLYYDTSAVYVAPGSGGDWYDPNDTGAIGFTYDGPSVDGNINNSQSVTLHFSNTLDPSGTAMGDPGYNPGFRAGYFFHFGVSTNNLKNPGYPGAQSHNDGDAWGNWGVTATITFYNPNTNSSTEVSSVFVNTGGNDGISKAFFTNAGGGYPAVLAQGSTDVQGFCTQVFGVSLFQVSASATAYYDCSSGRSALVHVDNYDF